MFKSYMCFIIFLILVTCFAPLGARIPAEFSNISGISQEETLEVPQETAEFNVLTGETTTDDEMPELEVMINNNEMQPSVIQVYNILVSYALYHSDASREVLQILNHLDLGHCTPRGALEHFDLSADSYGTYDD